MYNSGAIWPIRVTISNDARNSSWHLITEQDYHEITITHSNTWSDFIMKSMFKYYLNMCSICLPFCCITASTRRRHSPTLLSRNDWLSFSHALTTARLFEFVDWGETLTVVDHLLQGTLHGINRIKIWTWRPHVWLNELDVLTLQVT